MRTTTFPRRRGRPLPLNAGREKVVALPKAKDDAIASQRREHDSSLPACPLAKWSLVRARTAQSPLRAVGSHEVSKNESIEPNIDDVPTALTESTMSEAKAEFSKLTLEGGEWRPDKRVFEVRTPHALAQAAGYLKFAMAGGGGVYFRGQTAQYDTMLPSLYRGLKRPHTISERDRELDDYIKRATPTAFLNGTPNDVHEPLLQHYGIRTRWLDLVDNVWTALWFGCHHLKYTGKLNEFVHYVPSDAEYVYIVLIQPGKEQPMDRKPGWWECGKATLVDLRRATPSLYLRPHAQHGLLFKRTKRPSDAGAMDLSEFVVGTISVPRSLASSWLGSGELTTVHHVFPPPVFDHGYRRLLENAPAGSKTIGAIQHVGA